MNSNDIAIKVENLSKRYRIGLKEEMQDNFISTIIETFKKPLKNYRKYRSLYKFSDIEPTQNAGLNNNLSDVIWALRDVSFDVKQGEAVGIIGSNGAGKSTLLKILAKVADPTSGRVEYQGRVSCLLEVGTGFHQELTGRENIYLNGTILGMTKEEVDRKFDEIVDFSGIERFIDTPVKRYSSGMTVRLAFSVAAHLEPEILLVDEVLAVGDVAFQKKCLGKMGKFASKGRTVLFVSHNMGAITQLCEKALWIEQGQLKLSGNSIDVVSSYLSSGADISGEWTSSSTVRTEDEIQIISANILSPDGSQESSIRFDSGFMIEISYQIIHPVRNLSIVFRMADSIGRIVFESMDTDSTELKAQLRQPGRYRSICKVPAPFLKPDRYHLSILSFVDGLKIIEHHENVLSFEVSESGYFLNTNRLGFVMPVLQWEVLADNPAN